MLSPCRDLPPKRAGSPHSDCRCCARDGLPSARLSDVLEDGHRKLTSILRSPRLCDELTRTYMIDLLLLLVAIGATTNRVNTGNTASRVASVRSRLYLSGCETWRSRLHCSPHSALRTTADSTAAPQRSHPRRDHLCPYRLRTV